MSVPGDGSPEPLVPSFSVSAGTALSTYVGGLRAAGYRVATGSAGTYWVAYRDRVVQRLPTFQLGTPSRSEVDHALRATGALVASYLTEAADDRAANAWLYLCGDRNYSLAARVPAMRRNVRRALRDLTLGSLTAADVLEHGSRAFCDTRRRNGLDDGTSSSFRRQFRYVDRPGATYLGAWRHGELAAFVAIIHVDDWAELGCFSMDSMLRYRPNDALMYLALSKYLAEERCRVVSFGVSAVQLNSDVAGLHRFKRKVGFEAHPVRRTFVLHPSLRPFASRRTSSAVMWAANAALSVRPGDRRLRKLAGMLACVLGTPAATRSLDDGLSIHRDSLCAP